MMNILVPTDFSYCSVNALKYAVEMAKAINGQIFLFHSIEGIEDIRRIKYAKQRLNTLVKASILPEDYNYVSEIACQVGEFEELVHDYCIAKSMQMIIMGSKGVYKVDNLVTGNHSTKVAGSNECPVLIIPENTQFSQPSQILYTLDYDGFDYDTFNTLKYFADCFK